MRTLLSRLLTTFRALAGMGTRIDTPLPLVRELDERPSAPSIDPDTASNEHMRAWLEERRRSREQAGAWLRDQRLANRPTRRVIEDRRLVSFVHRKGDC